MVEQKIQRVCNFLRTDSMPRSLRRPLASPFALLTKSRNPLQPHTIKKNQNVSSNNLTELCPSFSPSLYPLYFAV
uniref:Uncharacterized protein n=1 Tax=Lepeophtheirus salmonis TaxID=72036 RepID=A0A0K2TT55_LEPSM